MTCAMREIVANMHFMPQIVESLKFRLGPLHPCLPASFFPPTTELVCLTAQAHAAKNLLTVRYNKDCGHVLSHALSIHPARPTFPSLLSGTMSASSTDLRTRASRSGWVSPLLGVSAMATETASSHAISPVHPGAAAALAASTSSCEEEAGRRAQRVDEKLRKENGGTHLSYMCKFSDVTKREVFHRLGSVDGRVCTKDVGTLGSFVSR